MKRRITWVAILVYLVIFVVVTVGVCKVDFKNGLKPIKPCKKTEMKPCNQERGIRR